jgi:ammonium transporter, Amt family
MKHSFALTFLCTVVALATTFAPVGAYAQEAAAPAEPAMAAEAPAMAEPAAAPAAPPLTIDDLRIQIDTLWVLIAGFLVFFMNLGFGCVETGMCRAKNCVNILSKNFIVFAVSSAAFWFIGWDLMFGANADEAMNPYLGRVGTLLSGKDNSPATLTAYSGDYGSINWSGVPLWAKFFFQLVFAGTAATIVSGAVAERIKYHSFIIFSFIMGTVIYPVVGHWIWGGGFLGGGGFFDFAGSTQVHSVGGWAALSGAIILGPRIGKYTGGRVNAIPGHNMALATIGCFILWLGWFGFNPGSTMGMGTPALVAHICVTTNTAAAIAALTATATAWILLGKPDLGMTLNGCLAGLVAITAPCAFVTVGASALIGAIAGVLVVVSVLAFDRIGVDDPVGATSVHLVNGIFGTLAVGLFADPEIIALAAVTLKPGLLAGGGTEQLMIQLQGIACTGVYVFFATAIVWLLLKFTIGIRVSEHEEIEGLDLGEHGNEAYPGFVFKS